MDTKVILADANTFMGWFVETHVYTYPQQPLYWRDSLVIYLLSGIVIIQLQDSQH